MIMGVVPRFVVIKHSGCKIPHLPYMPVLKGKTPSKDIIRTADDGSEIINSCAKTMPISGQGIKPVRTEGDLSISYPASSTTSPVTSSCAVHFRDKN